MPTTVTIPEPLKVILDAEVEHNPEFSNRSVLIHRILWEWVKTQNNLKIEGDTASLEGSAT